MNMRSKITEILSKQEKKWQCFGVYFDTYIGLQTEFFKENAKKMRKIQCTLFIVESLVSRKLSTIARYSTIQIGVFK